MESIELSIIAGFKLNVSDDDDDCSACCVTSEIVSMSEMFDCDNSLGGEEDGTEDHIVLLYADEAELSSTPPENGSFTWLFMLSRLSGDVRLLGALTIRTSRH
jgi:hypothetical protein